MTGPQRKQRTPTIIKPVGAEFQTVNELKSKEEQRQKRNKLPHWVFKKKIILLPGPTNPKGL